MAVLGRSHHTLPIILQSLFEGIGRTLSEGFGFNEDMVLPGALADLSQKLEALLARDGVLIYPTHPVPAPYHGQSVLRPCNLSYTALFNILGFPATQVPLGLSRCGLPLGVQLISGKGMDRNSLAVANLVDKLMGGWHAPSPLEL